MIIILGKKWIAPGKTQVFLVEQLLHLVHVLAKGDAVRNGQMRDECTRYWGESGK
jgi:hypothetical protein